MKICVIGGGLAGPKRPSPPPPRHGSRSLRDAPFALHPGAPDSGLRRTRLLELTQIGKRKYRTLAAQAGDAPRRLAAPAMRRCDRGSRRPRSRRRPCRVFSRIAELIANEPRIRVIAKKSRTLDPRRRLTIVATGPLTSPALSAEIARLTGASTSPSTTPSAPSSRPTPSTWLASTSPRAGTRAPPTTSTAR